MAGGELIRKETVFNQTYDAWAALSDRANVVYDYRQFMVKEAA